MMIPDAEGDRALLWLLQLASPALPVGGYAYSEGLEALVAAGDLATAADLGTWLRGELAGGAIALDLTMLVRQYRSIALGDWGAVVARDRWLAATRETEELRTQSTQMGRSLSQLLDQLFQPDPAPRSPQGQDASTSWPLLHRALGDRCTWTTAFAAAAAIGGVGIEATGLAYGQGWAGNLVTAAVKAIPLGQTDGQRILLTLAGAIAAAVENAIAQPEDRAPDCCTWGLSLASMAHEAQYARLFRS